MNRDRLLLAATRFARRFDCQQASEALAAELRAEGFPAQVVRGYVLQTEGYLQHYWVEVAGTVVDVTGRGQFESDVPSVLVCSKPEYYSLDCGIVLDLGEAIEHMKRLVEAP